MFLIEYAFKGQYTCLQDKWKLWATLATGQVQNWNIFVPYFVSLPVTKFSVMSGYFTWVEPVLSAEDKVTYSGTLSADPGCAPNQHET